MHCCLDFRHPRGVTTGFVQRTTHPRRARGLTYRQMRLRQLFSLALLATLLAERALAQSGVLRLTVDTSWVNPASSAEEHWRYLQALGGLRQIPWSLRAFSRREQRGLFGGDTSQRSISPHLHVAPVHLQTWYNSTFPYGTNDGAVWQGRGLATMATGGFALEAGPIELVIAPVLTWSENRPFPLMAVPDSASPFADPLEGLVADRPQRFGDQPYVRLDPGATTLRFTAFGATAGISSAHEWWGPMSDFPFILGTNAPGFVHLFLGTAQPTSIRFGRIHGRLIYGELGQSSYSPVPPDSARRFSGGVIVVFEPRGFKGLEVGAARFFHIAWPDSLSTRYFTHLFETLLKGGIGRNVLNPASDQAGSSTDNQLASVFARWVLGGSGVELYGEYGREDHSATINDLLLEPDHSAVVGWGIRKAWRTSESMFGARIETINHQVSSLLRHRSQGGAYSHVFTRQGHTHRGQLLGSAATVGVGGGTAVQLDRFSRSGYAAVRLQRLTVRDAVTDPRTDVQYSARVERLTAPSSRGLQLHWALEAVAELNRYLTHDAGNMHAELGVRWRPR